MSTAFEGFRLFRKKLLNSYQRNVKYTSHNLLFSLLVNDDFINYVVNPSLILDEMWDDFFAEHPDMIQIADKAKSILLGEQLAQELPQADSDLLFSNVMQLVKA